MQTHYTPGPWVAEPSEKDPCEFRILHHDQWGSVHVAKLGIVNTTPKATTANAQLIAAAPDLVEALKLAAVELEILAEMHPRMCSKRKEATEKARAALQKAGVTL